MKLGALNVCVRVSVCVVCLLCVGGNDRIYLLIHVDNSVVAYKVQAYAVLDTRISG